MMFEKLKKELTRQSWELLSNPKIIKLLSDPRLMQLISHGLLLRGRLAMEFDGMGRKLAGTLKLATSDELNHLRETLLRLEQLVSRMERKIGDDNKR